MSRDERKCAQARREYEALLEEAERTMTWTIIQTAIRQAEAYSISPCGALNEGEGRA
jgi:hypothetical protein